MILIQFLFDWPEPNIECFLILRNVISNSVAVEIFHHEKILFSLNNREPSILNISL